MATIAFNEVTKQFDDGTIAVDNLSLDVKDGEKEKTGIMVWFAPDSKHDCSGCGGKVTVTSTGGGKGPTLSQYKHTCSKCGPESAYVCTDHKKA